MTFMTSMKIPSTLVKGQLSWGHCLKIFDVHGRELGIVKERVLTFLPRFEVYEGNQMIGSISKELTFLKPRYNIDFNGWHIEGDWTEWNYSIMDDTGRMAAVISKGTFSHDRHLCSGYRESGRCSACADVYTGS